MRCHYCGGAATTRDHVIPKSLGGPNKRWNLVLACEACNQRKGSQTYEAFTDRDRLPEGSKFRTTSDFLALIQMVGDARGTHWADRHPAFVADLRWRPRGGW